MKRIHVKTDAGAYLVVCARGALRRLGVILDGLDSGGEIFVLSSPRVWKHWGKSVAHAMRGLPSDSVILFDDREIAKRALTVERICRKLVRARADRRALLVAVGGGVVGDVAGFTAATYLRGVRIVHVPTTLVAQVDSAIGGKTGVDLPEGKNLIGAFHQPQMVVADPMTLQTLSPRQFRSGLYEVIKYGVIGDSELFSFLEREIPNLLRMNMPTLEWAIKRGVRQKAQIVSKDEREAGPRQLLNYGHTIGHALETLTGYKCFLHGEAIGWGMLGAAQIAIAMGRLGKAHADRISSLVARCGALPELPCVSAEALLRAVAGDKKSRGGRVGWVLPRRIGAAEFGVDVPDRVVAQIWRALPQLYAGIRRKN